MSSTGASMAATKRRKASELTSMRWARATTSSARSVAAASMKPVRVSPDRSAAARSTRSWRALTRRLMRPVRSSAVSPIPASVLTGYVRVDLDGRRLRAAQQLVVEGGRARLTPVPAAAQRTIALSPRIIGILAEHRERQGEDRVLAGDAWHDHDLVLCTPVGGWVSPERFSRVLDDLIGQAGVPRITPDGLRRTARALADDGRDVVWMQLDEVLAP